jgi:hypothetical protein
MKEDIPDWSKSPTILKPEDDVFLKFMKDVICGGDVLKCDYFLRYLYFVIFKQQKAGVCPVLYGDNKVGKSTFIHKLGELVGKDNFYTISNVNDISKVNLNYHTALLLYCDEVRNVKPSEYERLKSYITDASQTVKVSYHIHSHFINTLPVVLILY